MQTETETFQVMRYRVAHRGAPVDPKREPYSATLERGVDPRALLARWNALGGAEWSYELVAVETVRARRGTRNEPSGNWEGYAYVAPADEPCGRGGWVFLNKGRI